jgi:hypothetical protein
MANRPFCTLTQQPIAPHLHTLALPCTHTFSYPAFLEYCTTCTRDRPSEKLKCPNCRERIRLVILTTHNDGATSDESATVRFKYNGISYEMLLPSKLPSTEDEDELIRRTLKIPRGKMKVIGKRGTKSFAVLGTHEMLFAASAAAVPPLSMRFWDSFALPLLGFLEKALRLVSSFFQSMITPPKRD